MKKLLRIGLSFLVLALVAIGITTGLDTLRMSRTWSGFVYASMDRLYHKQVGSFDSLEECREGAHAALEIDPQLEDGRVADSFM